MYHDNNITNGTYANVGDIIQQGQIFNRTGTGGNVTGDHVHLETGKGQVNLSQYRYHFLETTSCKRIKPDEALFKNDTVIIPDSHDYYLGYHFIDFDGGITPPIPPTPSFTKKSKFPWVLYARKLRNKKNFKKYLT